MKFKPLFDRVIIRKTNENVSGGGIALLGKTSTSITAKVVAVGDGMRYQNGELCPIKVSPGQTILLEHDTGTPIQVDGQNLWMIREGEIAGVFVEEEVQQLRQVN